MFKARLYINLLHAGMLMQEKGNSNLCECNLKQYVQVPVHFSFTFFNFLSIFFLEEEEDWYYFIHVRAEDRVSINAGFSMHSHCLFNVLSVWS